MKKLFLLPIFAALFFLASFNFQNPKAKTPISKWKYSQDTDQMTDKINYYAENHAIKTIHASDLGDSKMTLMLRYKGIETSVLISIPRGQFNSDVVNGEEIKVRFDSGDVQTLICHEPSDNDDQTLFFPNPHGMIRQLLKAKKLLIQAEFYSHGVQTSEFNVSNLVWHHDPSDED